MTLRDHSAHRNKNGWVFESTNMHCFTITAKASRASLGAASALVQASALAAAVAVAAAAAAAAACVLK